MLSIMVRLLQTFSNCGNFQCFLHIKISWIFILKCSQGEGDVLKIYWHTEQRCRKFTTILATYVLVQQSILMIYFSYSIYCIHIGNLDTSTWPLPFRTAVPFETDSISGWYLKWFLQFNISLSYSSLLPFITSQFCCGCMYIDAICDHLASIFQSIDRNVGESQAKLNNRKTLLKTRKTEELMHEMINLHYKTFE